MYKLEREVIISAAHFLPNYDGCCRKMHGHNWRILVECRCDNTELDEQGMVIDFSDIKKICNRLDHTILNDFIKNPTAENVASYLYDNIARCYSVTVYEGEKSKVTFCPSCKK